MRKTFLTLIAIISAFFPVLSFSSLEFKHIGVREGLGNGFIVDAAIDRQGFIWAATEAGVSRISGSFVTEFTKSNSSICSNEIVCLYYYQKENQMWMGTKQSGISVFDCDTGEFSHLTEHDGLLSMDIADICSASNGDIWILHRNKGIQRYDADSGKLKNLSFGSHDRLSSQSRVCVDDGLGHLYVGHFGAGLSVVDLNKKIIRKYRHEDTTEDSLPSDYVRAILIDSQGNIWVGTNGGAARLNPLNGEIQVIDENMMAGDNIHDITETADGRIWLASDLGGVTILDWKTDNEDKDPETAGYSMLTVRNSSLSSPNARKVIEDSFGNIWIAHYSTGFDFIPSHPEIFNIVDFKNANGRYHRVYGIYSDSNDCLWLGGENELAEYSGGAIHHIWTIESLKNMKESIIYAIHQDYHGNLWLGINDVGVMQFDPKKGAFHQIDLGSPLDVHAFLEDEDGTIYIGTENRLYSYVSGRLSDEEEISKKLLSSAIYSMLRDGRGRLWIGTLSRGVFVFNKDKSLAYHFDETNGLPSNSVNQLFDDKRGKIWIATYNGLVSVQNIDDKPEYKIYNEKDGLSDSHIRAISEDRRGNLWVTTFKGVSCLRKNYDNFANFDYNDGLPEGGFVESSIAMTSNGVMFVGSPNGVGYFNPLDSEKNDTISCLQIVSMKCLDTHNKEWNIALDTENVTVPYDENSLRIEFTVMDYAQNQVAEYSYKMEGLDKNWRFLGNENSVTFRNLPPGTYNFKLRVRLKNGKWNNDGIYTKTIKVNPPIWLSWYFKIIYAAIILVIAYLIFRTYKKRLLLKNSFELQKKSLEVERKKHQDEQDLNNERMRFYTNIAHELRTPLTLIIGPLEDLAQDNGLPPAIEPQIRSIHSNSIRLLNLINQIMEFRKTETQNRQLTVAKGDLSAAVTEIGLRYKELHRNENVEFRLEVQQLNTPVYFDREIITTIITNFLSNAIKYTARGHIILGLDACMEGDVRYARIYVDDTGYGIDPSALPHIYDRYYQAKGKHQASGTGIGLALVKSLSELHKGILKVDSKLGVGSSFKFLISMSEIYPNAHHSEEYAKVENALMKETSLIDSDKCPSILVIEDNKEIRDYILRSFKNDFKVFEADNGKDGLDLALKNIPDIIISDIMMPEMDGIELCRMVKDDMRTSHIPVILLTAKDSLYDKEIGYEIGADSYITKPFSAKLLKLRVRNLLEGRRRLTKLIMQGNTTYMNPQATDKSSSDKEIPSVEIPQLSKLDTEFLKKLNGIIESNFATEKLDMAFFSDKMNMSHSTFYRKLKMLTGVTPVDYVKKIRLNKSLELIASGEFNITELAYQTGFNNPAHFRDAFKNEYGMSPSQYIKQRKPDSSEYLA